MTSHTSHDYERYEALLRDFGRHIKSYCVRRAGSAAEAADLVQEVSVRIWDSIGDLSEDCTPRQANRWVHKVMRSAVSDSLHRRRVVTVPLSEAVDTPVGNEVDNELIDDLLQRLDPDERQLMTGRLEGYSVAELAARHCLSPNAMSQRFFRIMKKLKQIYSDEYGKQ